MEHGDVDVAARRRGDRAVFGLVAPGIAEILIDSLVVAFGFLRRKVQFESSLRKSRRARAARRTTREREKKRGRSQLGFAGHRGGIVKFVEERRVRSGGEERRGGVHDLLEVVELFEGIEIHSGRVGREVFQRILRGMVDAVSVAHAAAWWGLHERDEATHTL